MASQVRREVPGEDVGGKTLDGGDGVRVSGSSIASKYAAVAEPESAYEKPAARVPGGSGCRGSAF